MIEHKIRRTGLVLTALVGIAGWACTASAAELMLPASGKAAGATPTEQKMPVAASRRAAPVRTSVVPRPRPAVRAPIRQYAFLERPQASFSRVGFLALGIGY